MSLQFFSIPWFFAGLIQALDLANVIFLLYFIHKFLLIPVDVPLLILIKNASFMVYGFIFGEDQL